MVLGFETYVKGMPFHKLHKRLLGLFIIGIGFVL